MIFTSIESKICETSFQSLKKFENIRKLLLKKRKKKECRLKSSIKIEKIDQFRTKTMRIWLKKSLRRESCLNRRLTKEKQRLSWRRSCSSDSSWRFRFYKRCKCCFVDWSLCSRQRFSKRFSSTNTTLRSFLIDMRICVRITSSRRKKEFVLCFVIVIL